MERIFVEITPENLKFIRERKEKDFVPIKLSVNEALNRLRKEKSKTSK